MKYRIHWKSRMTGYEDHSDFDTHDRIFDRVEWLRERPIARFLEYWVEDTTGKQYQHAVSKGETDDERDDLA